MTDSLGISRAGYYGLDTLTLNGDISIDYQVVGIYNDTTTWTGILGLGYQGTSFGETDSLSFLDTLVNQSVIPSCSYGYTAGASYRLKQVPASLTIGGYDSSRFHSSQASFDLNSNAEPTLFIGSISVSGWNNQSSITLFDASSTIDPDLYIIDTTTPFLWLPENVAQQFEKTFGLIYNDTLGLYMYPNTSTQDSLGAEQVFFNFNLTNGGSFVGETSMVSEIITLPGQTFTSSKLTYGFPNLNIGPRDSPVPYFPVRKAINSTRYVIGRMFLQETYLIVDYDRNNFSLSQALFRADALSSINLVDIPPQTTTISATVPNQPASQPLSTGAIVGIIIGSICLLLIIVGTVLILLGRRRNRLAGSDTPKLTIWEMLRGKKSHSEIPELGGNPRIFRSIQEKPSELFNTQINELNGGKNDSYDTTELPGHIISEKPIILGVDHDPSQPVELPLRSSTEFVRNDTILPLYSAPSPAQSHFNSPTSPSHGSVSPIFPPYTASEKGGTAPVSPLVPLSARSGTMTFNFGNEDTNTSESLKPTSSRGFSRARSTRSEGQSYFLEDSESGGSRNASAAEIKDSESPVNSKRFSWQSDEEG
jgi:hypothetical protein